MAIDVIDQGSSDRLLLGGMMADAARFVDQTVI
jgi:hypothetical protein